MRRHLMTFAVLLTTIAALPMKSFALPAPMSEQDLTDRSDVVALVRVVSVTLTTVTKDDQTGEELPGYLAKLQVLKIKKGEAKEGEELLVTWRAIPKGILGPWTVYYYPGEEVWTHLVKRSGGVTYASTWWNAKGDDVKAPESKDLPTTPGETLLAPQDPDWRMPL